MTTEPSHDNCSEEAGNVGHPSADRLRSPVQRYWPFLAILGVVAAGFAKAVTSAEFLGDDWVFLYQYRSLGLGTLLAPVNAYHMAQVSALYFSLVRILCGNSAPCFAFGNLVLHTLNTVLVLRISRCLGAGPSMSLAAAALYGSHYLISESVFWVSGNFTLVMVTFYLLALHTYMRALDGGRAQWPRVALAYLFGILCIFAHESGVTVFVACLAYELVWRLDGRGSVRPSVSLGVIRGFLLRAIGAAACVSLLLLSKAVTGTRMTISEHPGVGRLPALVADYFLRLWIPSEAGTAKITGTPILMPVFVHFVESPRLLAAVLLLCVFFPAAMIAWRGSLAQRFAFVWTAVAVTAVSYGAEHCQSRYFALVAAPGSLLFVTTFSAVASRVGRRFNLNEKYLRLALVIPILYGIIHNQQVGEQYAQAGALVRRLVHSPTLLRALHERETRRLVVLNLPDHREPRWSAVDDAYVFRNGFDMAVELTHGEHFAVKADDVSVGRLTGYDLSRNAWTDQPELSPQALREHIQKNDALVLQFDPERADFVVVNDRTLAGSQPP